MKPRSLTIIASYRCNAECRECCFESNPRLTQRLSLDEIKQAIEEAVESFPSIKIAVFTGGEVFLLKDDLYEAIFFANQCGLLTRCVTNGFWGKTEAIARRTVSKLVDAGLTEINISTGFDHQEFVPFKSIENASKELVSAGIRTLVTIEADKADSNCIRTALVNPVFKSLLENNPNLFSFQANTWMPFKTTYEDRKANLTISSGTEGCQQLLSSIVITPYRRMAACCGLTFEHIPELTLGDLNTSRMKDLYVKATNDFLKIWIYTDGPNTILRKLFGDEVEEELAQFKHICQACVVLHKHPKVRNEIKTRYKEFIPEVVSRYALRTTMERAIEEEGK